MSGWQSIPTRNLEAWKDYQLGRRRLEQRNYRSTRGSRSVLSKGHRPRPRFRARVRGVGRDLTGADVLQRCTTQRSDVEGGQWYWPKAMALDENLGAAHATAAALANDRREFTRAEAGFHKAIELDPELRDDAPVVRVSPGASGTFRRVTAANGTGRGTRSALESCTVHGRIECLEASDASTRRCSVWTGPWRSIPRWRFRTPSVDKSWHWASIAGTLQSRGGSRPNSATRKVLRLPIGWRWPTQSWAWTSDATRWSDRRAQSRRGDRRHGPDSGPDSRLSRCAGTIGTGGRKSAGDLAHRHHRAAPAARCRPSRGPTGSCPCTLRHRLSRAGCARRAAARHCELHCGRRPGAGPAADRRERDGRSCSSVVPANSCRSLGRRRLERKRSCR